MTSPPERPLLRWPRAIPLPVRIAFGLAVAMAPVPAALVWWPSLGALSLVVAATLASVGVTLIALDVHRLQQRARDLEPGAARYRHLVDDVSDAILVLTPALRVEMASARATDLLGRRAEEVLGRHFTDLFGSDAAVRALAVDDTITFPLTLSRANATSFAAEVSARRLAEGCVQLIVRDVTSALQVVEDIRQERELLDGILETSAAAVLAFELPSRRLLFANRRLSEVTGASRDLLQAVGISGIGWEFADLDGVVLPPDRLPSARVLAARTLVRGERMLARRPGGHWRVFNFSGAPLFNGDGEIRALIFSFDDVTDRERSQQTLAESEERLRRITDAVPGTVFQYVLTPSGEQRFEFVSAGIRELLRRSPAEAIESFATVWETILPEDQERIARTILESAASRTRWSEEFQVQVSSGDRKWVRGTSIPEPALPDGSIRWNGLLLDITEQKRLEGDLLQIQKMESIGRLAGGIAHDFNNILTAIRGNVDLLLDDVPEGHASLVGLGDIRDAAERATALTRQLLAFSRKQAMQTRDLDLASLVRDMEKMLRRVIGEDVVLLTQPSDNVGMVRADPGQLEQVLLNLAVNARDAMATGGLLTIETRNVRLDASTASALALGVGDYVCLVVRDTGHGMDDETKSRVFDPFFTTKPAGKGTGLGLAMVYGIVRQSNGAVSVDSDPDRGATFRLYFPRVPTPSERIVPFMPSPTDGITLRREASLLLVEDDQAVRALTRRILQEAGYSVREASDAYEALGMVGPDCAGIDLVVSDVIMPGMGGRDLANELRVRRPDLRILFISGYLDIDLAALGLDQRTRLLSKPFTRESLLRNIAVLLDVDAATVSGAA
ncbi:MAG: response regulator [Cytophagaceae bacterium]|nr:response regulator [Gemmatimonadaceae bacterium]